MPRVVVALALLSQAAQGLIHQTGLAAGKVRRDAPQTWVKKGQNEAATADIAGSANWLNDMTAAISGLKKTATDGPDGRRSGLEPTIDDPLAELCAAMGACSRVGMGDADSTGKLSNDHSQFSNWANDDAVSTRQIPPISRTGDFTRLPWENEEVVRRAVGGQSSFRE